MTIQSVVITLGILVFLVVGCGGTEPTTSDVLPPRSESTSTNTPKPTSTLPSTNTPQSESNSQREDAPEEGVSAQLQFHAPTATVTPRPPTATATVTATPWPSTATPSPQPQSVLQRQDAPPEGISAQLQFYAPTATSSPQPGFFCPLITPNESVDLGETEILRKRDFCLDEFKSGVEIYLELSRPDGSILETNSIMIDTDGIGRWSFTVPPGEPLGNYSVTVQQGDLQGTGQIIVYASSYPRISLLSNYSSPPGSRFEFVVAGFQESAPLPLYKQVGTYPETWDFVTTIASPDVDERGEGILVIQTTPDDPAGAYMLDGIRFRIEEP